MGDDSLPLLEPDQRWSTWPDTEGSASRGPEPYPEWLVTTGSAIDTELGLIKPGKEASLHLIERRATDDSAVCLMGAKRYKPSVTGWTLYAQGRDLRSARDKRALKKMSAYGRAVAQSEWATTEFKFLRLFWSNAVPVPYPVQITGAEILLEWIGDDAGHSCPQLHDAEVSLSQAEQLYEEVRAAIVTMAGLGYAHGDLSAYNMLVRDGHIVIIDLPQTVDLVKNPMGVPLLERDCDNVCQYFARHGVAVDSGALFSEAISQAWG